jgi:hypothetical protein
MAGETRKLLASARLPQLGVPEQYGKGVGVVETLAPTEDGGLGIIDKELAPEKDVAASAEVIAERARQALSNWQAAKAAKSGVNQAIKPLNELADLVRTVAETHRREPDTITGHVAGALLRLSPDERALVLRRAGRPEVFEPLLGGGLAEPPAAPAKAKRGSAKKQKFAQATNEAVERAGPRTLLVPKQAEPPAPKRGEERVEVEQPGTDWSEAQKARGWRRVTIAPDGPQARQRNLIQVLKDAQVQATRGGVLIAPKRAQTSEAAPGNSVLDLFGGLLDATVTRDSQQAPLKGGVGDGPALSGLFDDEEGARAAARATINAETPTWDRSHLAVSARHSAHMVRPDYLNSKNKVVKSADTHSHFEPKDGVTPLDVPAARGLSPLHGMLDTAEQRPRGGSGGLTQDDMEFWGMTEGAASTRGTARSRLAGDQLGQLAKAEDAAEQTGGAATLPRVVQPSRDRRAAVAAFVDENIGTLPRGVRLPALYSVLRGSQSSTQAVKAASRWLDQQDVELRRALYDVAMPSSGPDPDTVVTTGTSQRPGARWSGKKPLEIEREVQRRNLGAYEKVIVPLYQKTAPVRKEYQFEGVSEAEAEASGLFSAPIDNEATVDLDQMFPWWRAPFALVDAEGNYSYPNLMPSGQHITAMIRSLFSIEDPDFMERITPLIERSIAAAPDQPTTPDAAAYWNGEPFLASPSMEKAARAGVGSQDYPYPVYGERAVQRPPAAKPIRNIEDQLGRDPTAASPEEAAAEAELMRLMGEGAEAETPAPPPDSTDAEQQAIEELMRLMGEGDGPGTTDSASIYKLPQNSPMRFLLV